MRYDEFGNRTSQSGAGYNGNGTPPNVALTYNEATNRITTGGYSYDLNGNLTAMPGISEVQCARPRWFEIRNPQSAIRNRMIA